MDIDFIYFDVGGVVILDFSKTSKWNEMLDDMGIKETDRTRLNQLFDIEETKFCSGEKDTDSFIDTLKGQFGVTLPKDYSFIDDFVNRFDPNPLLGEIIIDLKKKHPIGLLTNMYPGMLDKIRSRGLLPSIDWNVIVDSSEEGFQKPQKEIFSFAVHMASTPANKILFVENSKMHTHVAERLGWNTLLYDPSNVEKSNNELLKILKGAHSKTL